jgi:orotidine-5'-phosphate decarboxylase
MRFAATSPLTRAGSADSFPWRGALDVVSTALDDATIGCAGAATGERLMTGVARALSHTPVQNMPATERLIVALDVPTVETASDIVHRLGSAVSFYKVGPHLQFAKGMAEFARDLVLREKKRLFLDFKSVDIGDTIDIAVKFTKTIGVEFITVYGTRSVIKAARQARGNSEFPKILVITLLTDHSEADMQEEFETKDTLEQFIEKRTKMVLASGGDGVICSPQEVAQIRDITGSDFLIVTPGIRPAWWPGNGHKRFGTPRQSVMAGADYLVVGRPIVASGDKAEAAWKVIREMEDASKEMT